MFNLYKGNAMMILENILKLEDAESIYESLISLGKTMPSYPHDLRCEENLVQGCQSIMYLYGELKDGKMFFFCDSEALISKGLAAFCIYLVNGKTPEEILKYPFEEIKQINLPLILSPSRSNGLKGLLLKIKNQALKAYVESSNRG